MKRILLFFFAALLTMAQTAWAAKETRTVTFYMDGCTSTTTMQDNHTLVSEGMVLYYSSNVPNSNYIQLTNNDGRKITNFRLSVIQNEADIKFTNLALIRPTLQPCCIYKAQPTTTISRRMTPTNQQTLRPLWAILMSAQQIS